MFNSKINNIYPFKISYLVAFASLLAHFGSAYAMEPAPRSEETAMVPECRPSEDSVFDGLVTFAGFIPFPKIYFFEVCYAACGSTEIGFLPYQLEALNNAWNDAILESNELKNESDALFQELFFLKLDERVKRRSIIGGQAQIIKNAYKHHLPVVPRNC